MKEVVRQVRRTCIAGGALLLPVLAGAQEPPPLAWATVANIADTIPGASVRFNSFNQPSVSGGGLVVMRARSKGSEGGGGTPVRGIYARQMGATPGLLTKVFDTSTAVPGPNNTGGSDGPTTFTEFPAFARIAADGSAIATRGQSEPLWVYTAPDGTETRVGTSGVYAWRGGVGLSAAGQFGAVPELSYYAVPGATPGTRFDQFPGAPTIASYGRIAFKGNWTDGVSKTGVFFRMASERQPTAPTVLIASSDMPIPGQPADGVRFGATAPPSAAGNKVVFLGVDNEDAPTLGGIYLAPVQPTPALTAMARIGDKVPGGPDESRFAKLGEALSFDGRFIGFWASWGAQTRTLVLICPTDGQAALIAYCNETYPNGHEVQVPVNQGFFVHDTLTGRTTRVVATGDRFVDLLYWTFSGRPPGVGEPDADDPEPPRWRAAAFVAVQGLNRGGAAQAVFKARRQGEPVVDGLYLATVGVVRPSELALAETGQPGTLLDPMAPAMSAITTLGVERDSLRNGWLAISASMADPVTGEGWAGVYAARTR